MQFKASTIFVACAVATLLATGCAKSSDQSTTTTTSMASAPATGVAMGDAVHGKAIFGANCAVCHGPTGNEGGVGPSLKGEKNRKNYAATIVWIHNPKPPMPKLWPQPLSDKDVSDVATYVQSL
jgi:mono/diheme cytochrome c family protein